MFDQVNGLPVHALVLHAAVVFVPLLALVSVVYAVVPRWRPRVGWAAALLAIAAPVTVWVAVESGEQLYDRLVQQGMRGPILGILDDHMNFGRLTLWFSVALGVATLVMVFFTLGRSGRGLPRPAEVVLAIVVVALAAVAGYYVFRTGDSGAHAVWGSGS
ncbi:hypothetical protein EV385_2129 [Krasilnikovia cinnamomea]|uniref:DUF2231 domain-containing protein n=1 Tax=Krasilnikovia cinnamomea TaxID=349313 RepID=A0A4Q7ZHR9_9ACTN|nr:DUF2231 domain-containing protein [Krasilnikovia cinnamomea]RZU50357.1 hypothetical protein EV385_2129 [Krasilnikovia cinnamomea]